ncbi:tyrosine-type recombinase/integrase [Brevibacillus laterosporus]|uniref:tyrosine-type recombinase/integrase n=1 Tax=Brevibacillus laterosporus TaxID=1465 RepID=UPI003D23AFB0
MADKRTGKRVKNQRKTVEESSEESLDHLFNIFYSAKIAEGRSARTLETYRENYRFLKDFLTTNDIPHRFDEITTNVIRNYIAWMLNEKRKWDGHKHKTEKDMTVGLSPVTVNTRLKGLRTFFKFLKDEGIIERNVFDFIKKVHEPESEIRVMSIEQLKKLLKAPDQRTYAGFRDHTIISVLIDGFMRIGEVLSLQKTDIDFEAGVLSLSSKLTKTRRARFVPLQKHTIKLLEELIEDSEEFNSPYIFLTNYGERLTNNQFGHRLKQHAETAGLKIRIYPHLFRHTAATLFLEGGGDLRHLQKILGHGDLRTIIKYTHLSQQSVISQHAQYSPLNKVVDKLNKYRRTFR